MRTGSAISKRCMVFEHATFLWTWSNWDPCSDEIKSALPSARREPESLRVPCVYIDYSSRNLLQVQQYISHVVESGGFGHVRERE